jgi:hypothetical protein
VEWFIFGLKWGVGPSADRGMRRAWGVAAWSWSQPPCSRLRHVRLPKGPRVRWLAERDRAGVARSAQGEPCLRGSCQTAQALLPRSRGKATPNAAAVLLEGRPSASNQSGAAQCLEGLDVMNGKQQLLLLFARTCVQCRTASNTGMHLLLPRTLNEHLRWHSSRAP